MATNTESAVPERPDEGLLVNALVGAVVSVVLAFLPFSPVLGGAVAGYLQKGDERTGLKVGAVSGAIASIPILLVLFLLFSVFSFVAIVPNGPGPGLPLAFGVLLLVVAGFVLLVVVGLSAVGGLVGAAIAKERAQPAVAAPPVNATGTPGAEPVETDPTVDEPPGGSEER